MQNLNPGFQMLNARNGGYHLKSEKRASMTCPDSAVP
jgi:hypothetical protein